MPLTTAPYHHRGPRSSPVRSVQTPTGTPTRAAAATPVHQRDDSHGVSGGGLGASTGSPGAGQDSDVPQLPTVLATSTTMSIAMPTFASSTNPLDASGPRPILLNHSTATNATGDSTVVSSKDHHSNPRASVTLDLTDEFQDIMDRKAPTKKQKRSHTRRVPRCSRIVLFVLCILGLGFGVGTLIESCLAVRSATTVSVEGTSPVFKTTYTTLITLYYVPIVVFSICVLAVMLVFLVLNLFAPRRIILSESDHRWLPLLLSIVTLALAIFGVYTSIIFSYDVVLNQRSPHIALAIVLDVVLFAHYFFFLLVPCWY